MLFCFGGGCLLEYFCFVYKNIKYGFNGYSFFEYNIKDIFMLIYFCLRKNIYNCNGKKKLIE